jgi:hypothetical protein
MVGAVNAFFDELGERFRLAAERRGYAIAAPRLSPAVARELLDLARVAAHTQERRFGPLASFMAGMAVEELRRAGGPSDDDARAALVREVREALEAAEGEPDQGAVPGGTTKG